MTTAEIQTAWPEHVIARCVTAGGATVDILDEVTTRNAYPGEEWHTLSGCCTGALCTWNDSWDARGDQYCWEKSEQPEPTYVKRLRELQTAVAKHARECRWMPKPEGGQR